MTTARPTLAAAPREVLGKKVAHLRRAGRLPAVVYGHGEGSVAVELDTKEFESLRRHTGPNTLIDLSVDGKKAKPVLVHGVQLDKLHGRPLHVDLFLVKMTEELTVDVPLVPDGVPPAVDLLGGTLLLQHESLKVRALPDHLPQSISLPVAALVDFDAVVHVSDLEIPSDVTLLSDPDEVIAKVQAPRIEVEEVPVAEVPEGEEAEGEAAEGAEAGGGAEGAGGGDSGSGEDRSEG
jgi:large subunit ribosomal protein L25